MRTFLAGWLVVLVALPGGAQEDAEAAQRIAALEAKVLELEARLSAPDRQTAIVVLTPEQAEALLVEAQDAEAEAVRAAMPDAADHPAAKKMAEQLERYENWLQQETIDAKREKLTERITETQTKLEAMQAELIGRDPQVTAARQRQQQLSDAIARQRSGATIDLVEALDESPRPEAAKPTQELDDGLPPLNAKVLAYAESQIGKKDGNGECWTLADHALDAAGADHPAVYVFGDLLGEDDTPLPGDIMQFEGVRFEWKEGRRNFWSTMAHHTAVIRDVNPRRPYRIEILHQNAGELGKIVHKADLNLKHQVSGTIMIYRPRP
ncbi:MAG: hypothetical protein AAF911_05125 [Planctomycetota bacterium]